jgi:hypothetical protein
MFTIRQQLLEAQSLIDDYRYAEARAILRGIDHSTARKWLEEIQDYRDNVPPDQQHIKRKNDDYYVIDDNYDYEYVAVPQQDYTTAAIMTLILYFVGFIPGLVVNLLVLFKARQEEALTGVTPVGMGCLTSLFLFFVILPFFFLCMICPMTMVMF